MSSVRRHAWKPSEFKWESYVEAIEYEGATVSHLDRNSHVFIGERYRLDYNDQDERSLTMEGADIMWLGNEVFLYGFVERGRDADGLKRSGEFCKELWIVTP